MAPKGGKKKKESSNFPTEARGEDEDELQLLAKESDES